jgi:hypothetical protein
MLVERVKQRRRSPGYKRMFHWQTAQTLHRFDASFSLGCPI